jgi:hypothetical protein
MPELSAQIAALVKELRNSRDVEANWQAFETLVRGNEDQVVAELSMRWLRSVCDTFADFGNPIERRDALAISVFINMVRFAETVRYLRGPILPGRLAEAKSKRLPLYEELWTFHIDKQDVYLNVAKRMARQLRGTGLMEKIWHEVLRRYLAGNNVITELRDLSEMPERYFPLEPLGLADNYGVV